MESVHKLAKLTAPLPNRVLTRSRQFQKLDQALLGRLTWLAAPGGAGKTTLAASYLQARGIPAVWYHLDAGDNDIASFFSYLTIAAAEVAPQEAERLPVFSAHYTANMATFARNWFRRFFVAIAGRSVLVFDDYHEIPPDSLLHDVLREGLAEVPTGMSVLFLSRGDLPPQLTRWRMRDDFTLLGWEFLRLSKTESEQIAKLRVPEKQVDNTEISELHERCQGWVAGLILMLEQQVDPVSNAPQANSPLVFDYFAGEILARSDPKLRQFLVATALLPRLVPSMAAALTDTPEAGDILFDLYRRNYFTVRHADGANDEWVYEYHPLFREFLRSQAQKELPAEELGRLKVRAAQLIVSAGEVEPAVALLCEAGEWQKLAGLVRDNANELLRSGRHRTLSEWLEQLPHEWLSGEPWLRWYLGVCRLPFNRSLARECFEASFESFVQRNEAEGAYLAWASIVDTYLYEWSDMRPLDRWLEELDSLRGRYPEFSNLEVESRVAAGAFAALMYRRPEHPDLPLWAGRLEELLRGGDPLLRVTAGNHLVLYHTWWRSDLERADRLIKEFEVEPAVSQVMPLAAIAWEAARAACAWMKGESRACVDAVERGLLLAEQTGVHAWDFMLLSQKVWAALNLGSLDEAQAGLSEAAKRLDGSRLLDLGHHYYQHAMLALYRNDFPTFRMYAGEARRIIERCGVPWAMSMAGVTMARVHRLEGEMAAAQAELERAKRIMQGICPDGSLMWGALATEAGFALSSGNEEALAPLLRQLFDRKGQKHLLYSASCTRSDAIAPLCTAALERGIATEQVQWLVRRREIIPENPPRHLAAWPWRLVIRTLGGFSLEIGGQPFTFGKGKVPKRPLELLKVLVAFGGESVAVQPICEALWPDAEGDAAYRSFVTTLQRLRKLLGDNDLLIYQDSRLSLDFRRCWVDALAFDLLTDADEHELGRLEQALRLYAGPFLPQDIDAAWAIPLRKRLAKRFVRTVCRLGGHYERNGDLQAAVARYEKGLEIDHAAEDFYRSLMACYGQLGETAEVAQIYGRCRDVLQAELLVEPSRETESLRRKLLPS